MNIDIKICEDDEIQLKYIEEKVKIILNDTNYNIECFTSAGDLLNSNLEKIDILILGRSTKSSPCARTFSVWYA